MLIVSFLSILCLHLLFFFFFNDTATTEIYTLSLHDALPICTGEEGRRHAKAEDLRGGQIDDQIELGRLLDRSEEHTSELQSPCNLVCRLLLEKKKNYPPQYVLMHTHYADMTL